MRTDVSQRNRSCRLAVVETVTTNQHTISEFAKRIDAAVATWKRKIRREYEATPVTSDAARSGDADALRRAAADLAADLAAILAEFERETARATAFETEAMHAIRRGDDRAARGALLKQQESADRIQQLDAEATVLRAILAHIQDSPGCGRVG